MSIKKKAVFVLDGGLSNDTWRKSAKTQEEYDELGCNDEPNVDVVRELKLYKDNGYEIIITSDRNRRETSPMIQWIIRNAGLRSGEYTLMNGMNSSAANFAAVQRDVEAIFTPDEKHCEDLYAFGIVPQIYLIKDGELTNYVEQRREQEDEYARLHPVPDQPEEIDFSSADQPKELPLENADIDDQTAPANVFQSPVADKIVIVCVAENSVSPEINNAVRKLAKEGYAFAFIVSDHRSNESAVMDQIRKKFTELQNGQFIVAFRAENSSRNQHVLNSIIYIDSMATSNGGAIFALLTNEDAARIACDTFIGGGIAAQETHEIDQVIASLTEIAKITRGEYDNVLKDDDGPGTDGSEGDHKEAVNHPKHYNSHPSGIECIEIVRHMSFNLGNVFKYLWRFDHKGVALEDLQKAAWYLNDEIETRKNSLREG